MQIYKRERGLSHEDSNLDKQNQNLSYYLYTMGQRSAKVTFRLYNFKTERAQFQKCFAGIKANRSITRL